MSKSPELARSLEELNLTNMTKNDPPAPADHWPLHDAKARFSELVRAAELHGPQYVTVHGREAVVVLAAREFERCRPGRTGAALVEAMRACPDPDFKFGSLPISSPIRDVDF